VEKSKTGQRFEEQTRGPRVVEERGERFTSPVEKYETGQRVGEQKRGPRVVEERGERFTTQVDKYETGQRVGEQIRGPRVVEESDERFATTEVDKFGKASPKFLLKSKQNANVRNKGYLEEEIIETNDNFLPIDLEIQELQIDRRSYLKTSTARIDVEEVGFSPSPINMVESYGPSPKSGAELDFAFRGRPNGSKVVFEEKEKVFVGQPKYQNSKGFVEETEEISFKQPRNPNSRMVEEEFVVEQPRTTKSRVGFQERDILISEQPRNTNSRKNEEKFAVEQSRNTNSKVGVQEIETLISKQPRNANSKRIEEMVIRQPSVTVDQQRETWEQSRPIINSPVPKTTTGQKVLNDRYY